MYKSNKTLHEEKRKHLQRSERAYYIASRLIWHSEEIDENSKISGSGGTGKNKGNNNIGGTGKNSHIASYSQSGSSSEIHIVGSYSNQAEGSTEAFKNNGISGIGENSETCVNGEIVSKNHHAESSTEALDC